MSTRETTYSNSSALGQVVSALMFSPISLDEGYALSDPTASSISAIAATPEGELWAVGGKRVARRICK